VALLKFFNAIARNEGYTPSDPFPSFDWWLRVRKIWLQHFQSVVLHDYLPRVVDCATYRDVIDNGRRIILAAGEKKDSDWFPLEFAAAFGRFGHSMIRDNYQPWNCKVIHLPATSVKEFMKFSYANSGNFLAPDYRLEQKWIANWLPLFDFAGTAQYDSISVPPTMAAAIDTNLASDLHDLPKCLLDAYCEVDDILSEDPKRRFGLASTTLVRGREFQIASAQQAFEFARTKYGLSFPMLKRPELAGSDDGVRCVFEHYPELSENTPMWYYILREAERFAGGQKLGPLGGRIVMETLHAAIDASDDSILNDGSWRPSLPRVNESFFTMPDLLAFAGHPNPLEPLCG
jgi:hypothetical protein